MIRWIISFSFLALAVNGEYCYAEATRACGKIDAGIGNCTAKYSGVQTVQNHLHKYTAAHIDQNFHYLLMAAYFNNYEANREGFSKLYRKLADDAWDDTLDLIKYMGKRGFKMNFSERPRNPVMIESYKMHELGSLATALDMQKSLAEEGHDLHSHVSVHHKGTHDAETMNFIETEFVNKHADTIRDLAGHVNDLHQLIAANKDSSLAIYLFDEHLQKILS